MDYINANISTIADLDNIDDKFEELKGLKARIKRIAEKKSKSIDEDDEDNEGQKRMKTEAEAVLNALRKIRGLELAEDHTNDTTNERELEKVEEDYGELQAVSQLRTKYERKRDILKSIDFLNTAKSVEERIAELDASKEELFPEIAKAIDDLNGYKSDCKEDVVREILANFRSKISIARKSSEDDLRRILRETKLLDQLAQPMKISSSEIAELESKFTNLIHLQQLYQVPQYPHSWWALDVLLEPIFVRFNYHFNTPHRETNKLSKPEWALQFVDNFLSEKLRYLELTFEHSFTITKRIFAYELITALLNPIREKMHGMLKSIDENIEKFRLDPVKLEKNGRLLSHLIYELSSFDQRLRTSYKYNPYIEDLSIIPTRKWGGITADVFLHDSDESLAADNWLSFELSLAEKRFSSEILGFDDAFKIDFDYHVSEEGMDSKRSSYILKPTYSAYNLTRLLNNLTNHFNTLSIVKYQLKYVSVIHLKLIDSYIERLRSLFKHSKEFSNLSFIPGGMSSESLSSDVKSSLGAVEEITQVYCLAKYVQENLYLWSNELIYIQLWNAFKAFSSKDYNEDLTIFDLSIDQYQELINKCIARFEDFFEREMKLLLKNYVTSANWNIKSLPDGAEPSPDLSPLIGNLPMYLEYLKRALSDLDYYVITDRIVTRLSKIFQDYVITNNTFTPQGIEQLKLDFRYLADSFGIDLFLNNNNTNVSNLHNKNYLKVSQSIELLSSLNGLSAKSYKNNTVKFRELRSNFDSQLHDLNDYELNDIVSRII
ncbi:uncharacterized protein PRCAT00000369001 [Priceomyces carsonii]|uniref:uncharacterized protein n=1 Tax=Priceomyces carsonii TaxID=28549 RepID=UPI002ED922B2|nr:unnamed protein product [Priceomyces carsonii]